jgi:L-erythro-3,5-diaminohexanoate dehydrogenase
MVDWFGISRVVGEPGVLPQRAQKLDASLPLREGELLIDVERLNIDAASFKQLKAQCGGDAKALAGAVEAIVAERGKMQNLVTHSGGMLVGKIREVNAKHPQFSTLQVGQRIATLVSLTLTPLAIRRINAVKLDIDRVDIEGHAILFPSGIFALLPDDLPETLSLAALDVAGAPALVARYVKPGMTVLMLGAGKSGALCLAQARAAMAGQGELIAADISQSALDSLKQLELCDRSLVIDATAAVATMEKVAALTNGRMADLVINCASVANTEMASVLSCRDGGQVIFFSMATSFTAAALGAEGVGKDVTMVVGNGFVPGHAELTFKLLKENPRLKAFFAERYC